MNSKAVTLRDSIIITGTGIYCSIGKNIAEFTESLQAGRDGIDLITRFSTEAFDAKYGALLSDSDYEELINKFPDTNLRISMSIISAKEAYNDARLHHYPPERVALVAGICIGKMHDTFEDNPNTGKQKNNYRNIRLQDQTHLIAKHLGIQGPVIAISTACASSAHALGFAFDLLQNDFVDAVVTGGTSEVTPEMYAGFYALGNMSTSPCAPFSVPIGLNLGEGAGFFVLERYSPDRHEPDRIKGTLLGYGTASDAYHPTTPDPSGAGVARGMISAIRNAGIVPAEIGYINVHGTGTQENDQGEWLAIKKVFGKQAEVLPVSSSKSFLGHTGAAAGILEAITTLICINMQVVPPTIHFTQPRRLSPSDAVNTNIPRNHEYSTALCCNSAFGGANISLLLSKDDYTRKHSAPYRKVKILGTGSVSCCGTNNIDKLDSCSKEELFTRTNVNQWNFSIPEYAAYEKDYDFSKFSKGRDEHYLDPISNFITAASSLALEDTGIETNVESGPNIGIVAGVSHIPSRSLKEFQQSIDRRGLRGISSHAFSRIVMNASMGLASEALSLKGPSSTIAAGEGAGLFAAAYACMLAADKDRAEVIVAVGADELGKIPFYMHKLEECEHLPAEGAACIILGGTETVKRRSVAEVQGIGIAGPQLLDHAITKSLDGKSPEEIDAVFYSHSGNVKMEELYNTTFYKIWGDSLSTVPLINIAEYMGYAEASGSLFALLLALEVSKKGFLKKGINPENSSRVKRALIVFDSYTSGSCSLLLDIGNNQEKG
jgi:3-oxoacyl-[acyl-carrier-protein] synthase II